MNEHSSTEEAVARLREALATIRFGSVEFIIHDGRVLQIDRKEKLRLDPAGKSRSAQGGPGTRFSSS
ncbi:MAG: YezD family protein [Gammaproteobacteria bacterium]|jgi:hypothetical protein|nr:YezD family protein [Gammaproteobacteria bacterium]